MKKIKLTKKEADLINALLYGEVRNYYTGSGRFSKKGANVAIQAADTLKALGMKAGIHFERNNDAPRGGWRGEYCRLTPKGRRWKIFSDLINERREAYKLIEIARKEAEQRAAERRAEMATYRAEKIEALNTLLANGESDEIKIMVSFFAAEFHPAPDQVLKIKTASKESWATLRKIYKK